MISPVYGDIRLLQYIPPEGGLLYFYSNLRENLLYGSLGVLLFPVVLFLCNFFSTKIPRIRPGVFTAIIGVLLMVPGAALLDNSVHRSLGVVLSVNAFLDIYLGPLLILFGYDAKFLRWFE